MSDRSDRHTRAGIESSHAAVRERLSALRTAGVTELTTPQVAEICGVHPSQIRRWRRTRGLYAPHWKGGPTPLDAVEQWLGTQPDPLNRKGREPAARVVPATRTATPPAPRLPQPPTRRVWI